MKGTSKLVLTLELLVYSESRIPTLPKSVHPSEEVLAGDSFYVWQTMVPLTW